MATTIELRDEVLGYQFSSANYSVRIINWLDEAQKRIAREAELPSLKTDVDLGVTAGTDFYTLPTDFDKLVSMIEHTTHSVLTPVSQDAWDSVSHIEGEESTGAPYAYRVNEETINIYPMPDADTYLVSMRYFRLPVTLDSGTNPEIPDDYHYLLVHYALWRAYAAEHDYEAANYHETQFQQGLLKLRGEQNHSFTDPPQVVEGTWSGYAR